MIVPAGTVLSPIARSEAAPAETMLRIGMLGHPSTLNPFVAYSYNDIFFESLIYDSLISFDEDLNPVPNLANSWCIVQDQIPLGSVWQYNLTHNAQWHDGEPFTADDVNFTVNYQIGPNFNYFWSNQPYTMFIDRAKKIDDYTVWIYFQNVSDVPAPCAFGDKLVLPIIPEHIWSLISPAAAGFSYTNSFPIGTGPFMATVNTYSEFLVGSNITLLRNPNHHWAMDFGEQVHFDKIALRFYDNDTNMSDDLKNGALDVAGFNSAKFDGLNEEIRTGLATNMTAMTGLRPDGWFSYLSVCMRETGASNNNARLDPFIRLAMAMATNRTEIVETIYRGYAMNGSTLVSPVFPEWHEDMGADELPFSPLGAAFLLELFGYSDNDSDGIREVGAGSLTAMMGWEPEGTPLSFELVVDVSNLEEVQIAYALQAQYLTIGIDMQISLVDPDYIAAIVYSYQYDMAILHWDQDPDPNRILFVESTYAINGWSDNAYTQVDYDQNYSASTSELDPATRQTYVHNCQYINYAESPYIVLAYLNQTYVRQNDTFTGWGDWGAHPGRSLDARWGANPLFFDLIPSAPNTPPTASFTVTPAGGDTTTSFTFNASGSSDPEDPTADLMVRWDWNNDGTWDTSWTTVKTAQHVFATTGTHTVVLAVQDMGGLESTTTRDVVVTVIPEFGTILVPALAAMTALFVLGGRLRRRE